VCARLVLGNGLIRTRGREGEELSWVIKTVRERRGWNGWHSSKRLENEGVE